MKGCLSLSLFFLIFSLPGCNEENCLSNNSSEVIINFVDSTGATAVQRFDLINAVGFSENIRYSQSNVGSTFILPVNPHDDKTIYRFITEDVIDTLSFTYSRTPRVLSSECPYEIQYQNLNVIDEETTLRYELGKNELTNTNVSNITIYR
ncbi:MAG: DUF6452 family protein [Bacteroidota bacterium]|nr:DUF6452 family protein [Bacteroidota bacterium]